MKTTLEIVTPAQASKWLEAHVNRDNRSMRASMVEMLAQQILNGSWQTTHQGIALSHTGRLLDGQHRLAAIVRAGQAVQIMVSRGCDEETYKVIDCGSKRAHFERAHLVDEPAVNRTICTAIATWLRSTTKRSGAASTSDIEGAFMAEDGKLSDSWVWLGEEWRHAPRGLRISGVLASLAIYHYINPERAGIFNEGYRSGESSEAGCPILALREAVVRHAGRVDYWVAQAAMRQHNQGLGYKAARVHLFAASEDMLGNRNTSLAIRDRSESAKKREAGKRTADSA